MWKWTEPNRIREMGREQMSEERAAQELSLQGPPAEDGAQTILTVDVP